MSEKPPEVPGRPHLRTTAMLQDASPGGDILSGWTVPQRNPVAAAFAAKQARGRVATASIEVVEFLRSLPWGSEVSCSCSLVLNVPALELRNRKCV